MISYSYDIMLLRYHTPMISYFYDIMKLWIHTYYEFISKKRSDIIVCDLWIHIPMISYFYDIIKLWVHTYYEFISKKRSYIIAWDLWYHGTLLWFHEAVNLNVIEGLIWPPQHRWQRRPSWPAAARRGAAVEPPSLSSKLQREHR